MALIMERHKRYAVRIEDRATFTFSSALIEGAQFFEGIVPDCEFNSAATFFGLAYEEGWLAFAEQLRARLKSVEFKEANVETVLEMLDVELSSRDAAVRRRSAPAPLEGEPTGNVVSFPGQRPRQLP
ncbi:hypothetical protein AB4097_21250 [Microvirga sp. 2MCAF35]|uniref:hypothetical protein n=1 Tax=Microvirga sp. 2MCAF35 TaxID=3232987 RepID=UPI003F98064A